MTDRGLRIALIAVSLAGAGVAAYVLMSRWADTGLICSTAGCETVQSSEYAELLGLPVAALGLGGYLLVAALAAFRSVRARAATAAVALGAALFSGYLLVVQLAVIDAVCDWCVANDVISSLVAVLALARLLQPAGLRLPA
jgi:uncharacterized membrane protein